MLLVMSRSELLARVASTNRLARSTARRFVAGETLDEALHAVGTLNAGGLLATLDLLGENVTTEAEARTTSDAYLEMLVRIRAAGARSSVSVKPTSLGLDVSEVLASDLVERIAAAAHSADDSIEVTIDMEGSDYTERTLDIFHSVHRRHANLAAVVQSMLYRSEADIEKLIDVGAHVRLCKGAYLEPPTIAYPDKRDSDRAYVRIAERMLSAEARSKGAYVGLATHDEAIIDWATAYAADHGVPHEAFEFQMLHGIRRDLQTTLVSRGHRVRVYVPYGTRWVPYFMRRLAERPENLAFVVRGVWTELMAR